MGEVYRARDTKLDREVAIKILPEVFVSDPDRVARFVREAHQAFDGEVRKLVATKRYPLGLRNAKHLGRLNR